MNTETTFSPDRSATLAILNYAKTQVQPMFAKAIAKHAIPPSPKPKFKWPVKINKLDPWKDFDHLETVGLYVTRDVKGLPESVEVVVEIVSYRLPDKNDSDDDGSVTLGNCFRLTGEQDWLSLEEEQEAKEAFKNRFGTNYDARD